MTERRNTLQKQLIMNAVSELDIHANAEQVFEYITEKHPSISKATVYRNLKQMAEDGQLLDIGIFNGATHYDHNRHDHHHFICEKCQRIFDVECDISEIRSRVKYAEAMEIIEINLSFKGHCGDCKDTRGNN